MDLYRRLGFDASVYLMRSCGKGSEAACTGYRIRVEGYLIPRAESRLILSAQNHITHPATITPPMNMAKQYRP